MAHQINRSAVLAAVVLLPAGTWGQSDARSGTMPATEVGARYGQARGAGDLCEGLKPSAKVETLAASFTGADLEAFNASASKVFQAWQETVTCRQGPNECRQAHNLSCAEAAREIGPNGSRLPGLLEPR